MVRKEIGGTWDRSSRISINDNFAELFNTKENVDKIAKETEEKATSAVTTANEAIQTADTTKQEMQQIIRDQTNAGDLVPEISQARKGENLLGDRLDLFDEKINEQKPKLYFNGDFGNYISAKTVAPKDAFAIECEFILDPEPRSEFGRLVIKSFNGLNGVEDASFALSFINYNKVRLRINFEDGTNIDITDPNPVTYGELHKAFVRWDNVTGVAELYVDGVLKIQSTPNLGRVRYNSDYALNIGAVLGNYPYKGVIGRTRMWGSSLTLEQVSSGYEYTPIYDSLIEYTSTITGSMTYQNWATITTRIQAFNTPQTSYESIGKDASGLYDIYAIYFGTKGKPVIMLNGSMHGTEWYGTQYILALMEMFKDNTFPDTAFRDYLYNNFYIVCIPSINPYGLDHTTDIYLQFNNEARYNANFAELNEDMHVGGFTQQESKVFKQMVEKYTPFAYVDCHMFQGNYDVAYGNNLIIGHGHDEVEHLRDAIADSWEQYTGMTVTRWNKVNSDESGLARAFVARTPNPWTPYTLAYITELCRPSDVDGVRIAPLTDDQILQFGVASLYFFLKSSTQYFYETSKGKLHDFKLDDGTGRTVINSIGQQKPINITGSKVKWIGNQSVTGTKIEKIINEIELKRKPIAINTLGLIKPLNAKVTPSYLSQGSYYFYISGNGDSVLFQSWMDSIGFNPANYGVIKEDLRAIVEVHINGNGTGKQIFTLFHYTSAVNYTTYGRFHRVSNFGTNWGKWHEDVFVVEKGDNANGHFIKYSNGVLECWGAIEAVSNFVQVSSGVWSSDTITWTFPSTFNSSKHIYVNGTTRAIFRVVNIAGAVSNKDVPFKVMHMTDAPSSFSGRVVLYAKGYWY